MSLFYARGSARTEIAADELRTGLFDALRQLGDRRRVLAVPPDFTRMHSKAGTLTEMAWEFYGERMVDVLPALGTHRAMTDAEIGRMFGRVPRELFRVHDWRNDVVTLGEVPGELVRELSEGKVEYGWPAQVNRLLRDGGHDLILSIGQVVPHEVVGMANGNKNVFIGTGGVMGIHRSHFLGAVYGMERMMGRADTPVRRVLNYASEHFAGEMPTIVYVLTVVAKDGAGRLVVRGLYVGDDAECFEMAAALSLECNFQMLDREIRKAVVYLDPGEFKSTWLGNKSVYRTRMAMADGGELVVLAPGVQEFGEDRTIDMLIRRHGYRGTTRTLEAVKEDAELAGNLSAAAHLIHGSSEGRFGIRYCPGGLRREEIEGAGYAYGDLGEAMARYRPEKLSDGWNVVHGEEIFYISNPGLGLWAYRERFQQLNQRGTAVAKLQRFSIGVGDRFAHQARAQLRACVMAGEAGVEVTPVWNKSNREHMIIGSEPGATRAAADGAVRALGWGKPYFLDADHIGLKTVDRFVVPCDFFTLDVAESIGKPSSPETVQAFVDRHPELVGEVRIPSIEQPFRTDVAFVRAVAKQFLAAVEEAGRIYRYLVQAKGEGGFVAEVSMDETDRPQTPVELLMILAAIADEGVPIQTIAPKFTGRFNKGVDYVGDVGQFAKEFNEDLAAISFAVKTYGLPGNLKLSVHSGSDKFRIYPAIHEAVMRSGAGVHLKTAGTTWLEELIGLAEAGGSGLQIAKEVYREAYLHADELMGPYAAVIDIDRGMLPRPETVEGWTSEQYTAALRHDREDPAYNPSLRQLLHVGFKVAAKMGDRYVRALDENEAVIARNVTENLFERHIAPVFLGRSR